MSDLLLLSGSTLAGRIRAAVTEAAHERAALLGRRPRVVSVVASADPATAAYVASKARTAEKVGVELEVRDLGAGCSQELIESTVAALSEDPRVDGVLIELPLAAGIDADRVLDRLHPDKDVDGMTAANLGKLLSGRRDGIVSATPQACVELAETHIPLRGRRVALIGRGRTVGRPLAALLLLHDATPVICHTRTENLAEVVRACDVVIAAAGRAGFVGEEMLRGRQVVIDAAINVVGDAIVGDVDRGAAERAGVAALSPVPGGVGPVTTAIAFRNVIRAIDLQGAR